MNGSFVENEHGGLTREQIKAQLQKSLEGKNVKKVLLIPPDITRINSGAGIITALYYELLQPAQVHILPALGTHVPMTRSEQIEFFGKEIPQSCYLEHNWREGVQKIGTIPADFVSSVSEGLMNESIDAELSNYALDPSYDLIVSIGQVVPHEVIGMANYTKNMLVGCGGSRFINTSHMLGAFYGMERIMGRDHSPVRKVFDYGEEHFLSKLPLMYVLTVTVTHGKKTDMLGLYTGYDRALFEKAVVMSQKHNLVYVKKPIQTCVVYLDENEFRSTWLGNKSIYRTRMAMATGGNLIVLAPGIDKCGEDAENDRVIKKYGYVGREKVLELFKTEADLQKNQGVAAHLIHGSSDGRFTITYATKLMPKDTVQKIGFKYMDYADALKKYNPEKLKAGYNTLDSGEEIYFIPNPALGLWAIEGCFK